MKIRKVVQVKIRKVVQVKIRKVVQVKIRKVVQVKISIIGTQKIIIVKMSFTNVKKSEKRVIYTEIERWMRGRREVFERSLSSRSTISRLKSEKYFIFFVINLIDSYPDLFV